MIVLSHDTAMDLYLSKNGILIQKPIHHLNTKTRIRPSVKEIQDGILDGSIPYRKIQILCMSPSDRIVMENVSCHTLTSMSPKQCLIRLGDELAVVSPELAFIQMCRSADFAGAAYMAHRISAAFCIDEDGMAGLCNRDTQTNIGSLYNFANKHDKVQGVKLAKRVTSLIPNGSAASPPEISLALFLSLPMAFGGIGLKGCQLNREIRYDRRSTSYDEKPFRIGDIVFEKERVAIEYDSDSIHSDRYARSRDAWRRSELMNHGWKIITVTTHQLYHFHELSAVAFSIGKTLNRRIRVTTANHEVKSQYLHSRLCELMRAESLCNSNTCIELIEAAKDPRKRK